MSRHIQISIGKLIKAARIAKKMTQQKLAVAAGTTQANITQIECHGRLPSIFLLTRLALALDLSPEDLKDARIKEDAELRRKTQEAEFDLSIGDGFDKWRPR